MITSLPDKQTSFQLPQTTERLRILLNSLLPAQDGTLPRIATPTEMASLLSELMRAGAWLRRLSDIELSRMPQELEGYRFQVERLRRLLPSLQSALLAERARLESKRDQVHAASEWAHTSRQTL